MYRDFTYYKMNNLDNRITNPDQLLTTDVERFCNSIVELYSNISKPMLDIVIYVQKLAFTIGGQVAHLKFPSRVAFALIFFYEGTRHYDALFVFIGLVAHPFAPPGESYDRFGTAARRRISIRQFTPHHKRRGSGLLSRKSSREADNVDSLYSFSTTA